LWPGVPARGRRVRRAPARSGRNGQGSRGRLGTRRGTPERRRRRTGRPRVLATPPAKTGGRTPSADPLDRRHRTIRAGPDARSPTTYLRALRTGPLIGPGATSGIALPPAAPPPLPVAGPWM